MSGGYPSLFGYLSTLRVQNFDVVQQARGRTNLGLAAIAATGSASDITTGTLSDNRLSSNIPLKNASINIFNGDVSFGGTVQLGGVGGPILKKVGNEIGTANATNTAFCDFFANKLISTNPSGGSNAIPADSVISFGTAGYAYRAGELIGRTYSANAAHGDIIIHARPNIGAYTPTNDLVVRGNTGNVEINRGQLVLSDLANSLSWKLKTQTGVALGQLDFISHTNDVKASLSQAGRLTLNGAVPGGNHVGLIVNNVAANAAGVKTQIQLPVFNGSGGGVIESVGNSIDGYRMNLYHVQASGILTFGTGGDNERMRIDASGNIIVGTGTAYGRFNLYGGGAYIAQDQIVAWHSAGTVRGQIVGDSTNNIRISTRVGGILTEGLIVNSSGNTIVSGTLQANEFTSTGLASIGMTPQTGRSLSILPQNTSNRTGVRVYDYGAFVSDTSQSGFEVAYLGGTIGTPSTTVTGHSRNLLSFRTGGSTGALSTIPSFAIRSTIGSVIGSALSEVNTSMMVTPTSTGVPIAAMTMLGQSGYVDFPQGHIQLGSNVRLKNNAGELQVRNSGDSAFANLQANQGVFATQLDIVTVNNTSQGLRIYNPNSTLDRIGQIFMGYPGYYDDQLMIMHNSAPALTISDGAVQSFRQLALLGSSQLLLHADNSNNAIQWSSTGAPGTRITALTDMRLAINYSDRVTLTASLLSITPNTSIAGHLTSAFQTLSSDPSTLDIGTGLSRLVKNTTSGKIAKFVNDGGVIKEVGTAPAQIITTPTGTTATLTLVNSSSQTLDLSSATGTVAVTLTTPGIVSKGSIIVKQGTTVRDFNVSVSSGTLQWIGFETDWATMAANSTSAFGWIYDGSVTYLFAADTSAGIAWGDITGKPNPILNIANGKLSFRIDGGGTVPTTGAKKVLFPVPYNCTITGWELVADVSGSIVVDIWKDTYANYPPVNADSITASAKPTLSGAIKANSTTLTGWTTTLNAGDYIELEVESASTLTVVVLTLTVTKT